MNRFPKFRLSELSTVPLAYGSGASAVPFDGRRRYIRITDLLPDGTLKSDAVSPSVFDAKYLLEPGDLLFARSGATVGKTYLHEASTVPSIYAGYLIRFKPDLTKTRPRYVFYFTQSVSYKKFIERNQKVVAQPNVNAKQYGALEIPLPPLAEQARIVAELDAVVATLKKRQAQLAELDALVESRFVELFGGERFPTVAIGDEFKTTSGGTPASKTREYYDGGAIPWLNSGEVNRGVVDYAENFITELGLKNSSAKWVPVDSVLVAMYGATVGKVGLLRIPATTNQAVCSILPNPQFCPRYLYFAVKSRERWMRSQALGGAQPNISQTVVKKMTIPKPPLELQERFAAEVERVEALKTTVRAGIAETQTLFDASTARYFG